MKVSIPKLWVLDYYIFIVSGTNQTIGVKIAIKLKSLTTYYSTYMYFCLFLLFVSKF